MDGPECLEGYEKAVIFSLSMILVGADFQNLSILIQVSYPSQCLSDSWQFENGNRQDPRALD
jgi:hypothetical protein